MARPTRTGPSARAVRFLSVAALLVGACGGGDSSAGPDSTTSGGDGTTTEATTAETAPEGTTPDESTEPSEVSNDSGFERAETMAVLTLGGDTYTFAIVDDGGSCNPDLFGIYRALLTRIDENGEPVEMPDLEGFTEGIDIVLANQGEAQTVIFGNFGGMAWSAGEDGNEESSIDSSSVDGPRAEGTATFINESGETVEGSFEVMCAEGSVTASGEGSDFCGEVAESVAMDESISLSDPDIEQILSQSIAEFDGFRAEAPAGIAPDVETLYQTLVVIDEILAAEGYDFNAVPEDEMQRLADPAIEGADQRLSEYCGLD